jgi:hypothetical protein
MKGTGQLLFGLASGDAIARGGPTVRKLHPSGEWEPSYGNEAGALSIANLDFTTSSVAVRSDGSLAMLTSQGDGSGTELTRYDTNGRPCGAPLAVTTPGIDAGSAAEAVLAMAPSGEVFLANWAPRPLDGGNPMQLLVSAFKP